MKQFNSLIIVADSCRYDSYVAAVTPNLDQRFEVVKAGATATFTYPAHMAFFQGFFPTTYGDRPIYNRFIMSVYRWFYKSHRTCISEISGSGSIPLVLRQHGHRTVAVGGVGWFNKQTPMRVGFEVFTHEPDTKAAVSLFLQALGSPSKEPFYGLLNLGVTHRPYICPLTDNDERSPRSGNTYPVGFNEVLWRRQVICMGYADSCLEPLFRWLSHCTLPTVACFCSDHGDCFGEDGCYGHAFYHPAIMDVPLGWTIFMPGGAHYPVSTENLQRCGL